ARRRLRRELRADRARKNDVRRYDDGRGVHARCRGGRCYQSALVDVWLELQLPLQQLARRALYLLDGSAQLRIAWRGIGEPLLGDVVAFLQRLQRAVDFSDERLEPRLGRRLEAALEIFWRRLALGDECLTSLGLGGVRAGVGFGRHRTRLLVLQ